VTQFIFDNVLGQEMAYVNNVKNNNPSTSVIGVLALAFAGYEGDDVIRTKTTVADLLSGATNEVTNTGYARINIGDSGLSALAVDNTAHAVTADAADEQFGGGADIQSGDRFWKSVFYYDANPATTTDADRIPLSCNDCDITPNGAPITLNITGFAKDEAKDEASA